MRSLRAPRGMRISNLADVHPMDREHVLSMKRDDAIDLVSELCTFFT
jgi:hypothetical protein